MAYARVDDTSYSLNAETTRIIFAAGLHTNPPHQDYNLFRSYGLIGNATPNTDFNTVVGKFPIGQAGSVKYYIRVPKYGEPTVGNKTGLRDNADTRERPSDKVQSVEFNMPGEQVGTEFSNAIVQAPKYKDIMVAIREWWDHFETEELIIKMAGFRGQNDGYEVFTQTQPGLASSDKASALSNIENMPPVFKDIHEVNNYTRPTRLLNSWSMPVTSASSDTSTDHDYSAAATWGAGDMFKWLYNLGLWLKKRSRKRDGYGISPAQINLPGELTEYKAIESQPQQYVLMMSAETAFTVMKHPEWAQHQQDLIQAYGLKQGKTTGFLGKVNNIVLVDNDLMPRFKAGANWFNRAFLFGSQAMSCGYNMHTIPVKYRPTVKSRKMRTSVLKTPYRCIVAPLNKGKDSELICWANFGSKVVSYPKPGSFDQSVDTSKPMYSPYGDNPTRVDRGRVCIDVMEDVS